MQAQRYWRDYFLTGEAKPEAPDYIKRASKIIEMINFSEEEAKMITLLEKAQADREAEVSDAYSDGWEGGMEKGMEKGVDIGELKKAIKMAKKMLDKKLPLDLIMEYTELSKKQIEEIS